MAPEPNTPAGDFGRILREAAPFLGLGTTLAVTVGGIFALGFWLDRKLGTGPILALTFGCFGIAAALFQFVKMASSFKKSKP